MSRAGRGQDGDKRPGHGRWTNKYKLHTGNFTANIGDAVQKNDGVQVLAVADNETTVIPLLTEQQLVADQDDEDVLRLLLLCSKLGLPVVASVMVAAMEQVVIAVMEQVMAAGARLLDVAGAGGGIGASGGGYVGHCCVGVGYG